MVTEADLAAKAERAETDLSSTDLSYEVGSAATSTTVARGNDPEWLQQQLEELCVENGD